MSYLNKSNYNLIQLYPEYVKHAVFSIIKTKNKFINIPDDIFDNLFLNFLNDYDNKKHEIEMLSNDLEKYKFVSRLFIHNVFYYYDYYYYSFDSCSLDSNVNNIEDLTISDIVGVDDYFSFDFEYLKYVFKKIELQYFDKNERNIIEDFILKGYDNSKIFKKYNVCQFDLVVILSYFRYKFAKSLLDTDFISKKEFDNLLNQNEGDIFSKNILINRLCLDLDLKEVSKILNLPLKYIRFAIFNIGRKFSLWDIQKLRKIYFKEYSLEELSEVVWCNI